MHVLLLEACCQYQYQALPRPLLLPPPHSLLPPLMLPQEGLALFCKGIPNSRHFHVDGCMNYVSFVRKDRCRRQRSRSRSTTPSSTAAAAISLLLPPGPPLLLWLLLLLY